MRKKKVAAKKKKKKKKNTRTSHIIEKIGFIKQNTTH